MNDQISKEIEQESTGKRQGGSGQKSFGFARMTNKKAERLLDTMEELADRAGIEVRYDVFKSGPVRSTSGNGRFNGKPLIVVDRTLKGRARAFALAKELAGFDLESVFIQPMVREFIDYVQDMGSDKS